MRRLQFLLLLTIAAVAAAHFALPAALPAEDAPSWPQFHGPNRDNKSTETGLLKQWPEAGPRLLWTAKGLGHGFSSVSIAAGRIYTAGNIGDKTVVTALDLSGKTLWQTENGPAWTKDVAGSRSTPTIDGGRLYHKSPVGRLACLDAKTGRKIWDLNILERFGAKNITWALPESVLVDGDRVICCPGGPETAVVALEKNTGQLAWKSPSAGDAAGYSSARLAELGGLRMILTMTSRALIGVSAETGGLLWRFEHRTPYDENILTPVYHDGHVFISTRTTGSVMLKIEVDGDKASVRPVWRSKQLDNQHGNTVLVHGYLYGSCYRANNAKWVCLEWKTGKMIYAERGVGRGSLTYADGMLYTYGQNGTMGLVRASPNTPQPLCSFRLPAQGQGPYWAHPVVCGRRLYLRHGEFLYCYDVQAR